MMPMSLREDEVIVVCEKAFAHQQEYKSYIQVVSDDVGTVLLCVDCIKAKRENHGAE